MKSLKEKNGCISITSFGGSNYDSLMYARSRSSSSSLLDSEIMPPCGTSVPCQLRPVVRRHDRGVLWAGGDSCMTGRLKYPLA